MAQSNVENFSPQIIRQIYKELCDLTQNPLEGIRVVYNEDDITCVQADIDGPAETPYYGGSFRIRLLLGKNFPASPPKGFFVTRIFHPNVGRNGEICVNTLKKDWNQDLGIKHILLTIKCLLIVPNPESALNEEAGKMILEQYEDYYKRAKMLTDIHAPKTRSINTCSSDCQQAASSSSVNPIGNTISNTNTGSNHTSSNITLFDKTASTSANIGVGGQKQPLEGVCCSEEPVTKRQNSILDCNNSAETQQSILQQQAPISQHPGQQKSNDSSQQATSSQQSKLSTMSNKNRGLKRVLRLRS